MTTCAEASKIAASVTGVAPAETSSTIRPSRTTIPRLAPSARTPKGSLLQIACAIVNALYLNLVLQFEDRYHQSCLALVLQDCYRKRGHVESVRIRMDLNTITAVARPKVRADLPVWTPGDAWLAGGTWLFSEPQAHLNRLIDLAALGWPALTIDANGLSIAATCTVAELDAIACPPDWLAAPLINQCCRAFLASFKIWKTATVGGNLCMSLPAGPMISLTSAFDGICTIWQTDGGERTVAMLDFVTGNQRNVLGAGDLVRQIDIPLAALKRRSAFRQISLAPAGRSAA